MLELELMMSLPSNVTIERGLRSKLNLLHDSDFGIVNKKEINNMAKVMNKKPRTKDYGSGKEAVVAEPEFHAGLIEYKMTQTLADTLVNDKKNRGKNPQQVLCDYVNEDLGLKGFCNKVIVGL
jgi:hypothetical protein